jgi:hypothetical protein
VAAARTTTFFIIQLSSTGFLHHSVVFHRLSSLFLIQALA